MIHGAPDLHSQNLQDTMLFGGWGTPPHKNRHRTYRAAARIFSGSFLCSQGDPNNKADAILCYNVLENPLKK